MYLVREKIFISLILLLSATISCASSDKLLNHDHELISAETLTKLLKKFLINKGIESYPSINKNKKFKNCGEPLKFFGHTAYTATSAAKLALKHDALLITFYVVRNNDGINFDLVFESPVTPTSANEMTQVLNNRLEKQIRKNMGQWLWTHRRWKSPNSIEE